MDEFRYGLTLIPFQAGDCDAALINHNFGDIRVFTVDAPKLNHN
ncbi:hypothetical protein OK016_05260 [Vibrio chagasii]|nr:hypothetical protein [Vibrio chagasii]